MRCALRCVASIISRIRLCTFARQLGEYPVEDPKLAPSDEAVVDSLVRAIVLRRIAPAQTILDHKDNPADHPSVIDTRYPMRQREIRRDPPHLRL